jgi:hypothetical protein
MVNSHRQQGHYLPLGLDEDRENLFSVTVTVQIGGDLATVNVTQNIVGFFLYLVAAQAISNLSGGCHHYW